MLCNILTCGNTTSFVVGTYECKILIQILVIQCTVKGKHLNAFCVSCLNCRHSSCRVISRECDCVISCCNIVVDQVRTLVSVKFLVTKCRSRNTKFFTLSFDTFLNALIESIVLCTNDKCQFQICKIFCFTSCCSIFCCGVFCCRISSFLCRGLCCRVSSGLTLGTTSGQRCNHHCCEQCC